MHAIGRTVIGIALISAMAGAFCGIWALCADESPPIQLLLPPEWKDSSCAPILGNLCSQELFDFAQSLKCIQKHKNRLGSECLKEAVELTLDAENIPNVCRPDVRDFCMKSSETFGNFMHCLISKGKAIAPACRVALFKLKHKS